jgi:molybdopterin synthase catalytic subunit
MHVTSDPEFFRAYRATASYQAVVRHEGVHLYLGLGRQSRQNVQRRYATQYEPMTSTDMAEIVRVALRLLSALLAY